MEVGIYIKSCFRGNPRGAGEAAAIIEYIDGSGKSHIRTKQFQIENDTRNALYLKTSIAAMRILLKPCYVTIYVDCDYMANTYRLGWLNKWHDDGLKCFCVTLFPCNIELFDRVKNCYCLAVCTNLCIYREHCFDMIPVSLSIIASIIIPKASIR